MAFNQHFRLGSSDDLDDFVELLSLLILRGRIIENNSTTSKKQLNLLLLGKTGNGKSATANTTLGRKMFECSASVTSVTSEVQCGQVMYEDYQVNIIDSPGLADTSFESKKLQEIENMVSNLEKVINMYHQGIHAFLFVFKFSNHFTEEEKSSLDCLRQILGHNFLTQHGIVVFTHGDLFEMSMEEENTPEKSFDTWCREQRGPLGNQMAQCSYRCVIFNNREKDEQENQKQLGSLIELAKNFQRPYNYLNYMSCEKSRDTLIVKLKEPQLKGQYERKIASLRLQIERICSRAGETEKATFLSMIVCAGALCSQINQEDKNTDVLRNLKEQAELIFCDINQHIMKQEEARRLRKKGPCAIQ